MPFGQHSQSHSHNTGGKRASDTERSEAWVISFLICDTKKVGPELSVSFSMTLNKVRPGLSVSFSMTRKEIYPDCEFLFLRH